MDESGVIGCRQDGVLKVRVLEEEVVDLVRRELPGLADQEGVIVVGECTERGGEDDRAGSVNVGVPLISEADLQKLFGIQVGAHLCRQEVVLERRGNDLTLDLRVDWLKGAVRL